MPTSKFNVGLKHKENSSMHAKTYLFLKTLLIQLKEEVKYNINKKSSYHQSRLSRPMGL
jgi:hypothetical protein